MCNVCGETHCRLLPGKSPMSSETDGPPVSTPATDVALPFAVVPVDQTLAKWVCPTCTGVMSDQPRACPRCGRDFVPGVLCLLYTSPSPRDQRGSRMPSSA